MVKLSKSPLLWDASSCHVEVEKELEVVTEATPPSGELKADERLMRYATDNLVVKVLDHPQLYTLHQCMRNMLASFTKHRHITHDGIAPNSSITPPIGHGREGRRQHNNGVARMQLSDSTNLACCSDAKQFAANND